MLLLSTLPGALVAALVAFPVYWTTQTVIVILPALILAIVMVVECLLAVEALGRVLDRTDVNSVDAQE